LQLSKSATLRRAVDHIQALRAKNAELAGENGRLKQALEMAGLPTPPAPPRDHASRLMKQESHHQQRQQNFQHGGPAAHPPNGQGPKNVLNLITLYRFGLAEIRSIILETTN
jgi:hypothetical protein